MRRGRFSVWLYVMERWNVEQDSDPGSGVNKMETTAGVWQQSGFICSAADNFQHTQKESSWACIDTRMALAARNTHYHYNQNGPLDHKMADCFLGPRK